MALELYKINMKGCNTSDQRVQKLSMSRVSRHKGLHHVTMSDLNV